MSLPSTGVTIGRSTSSGAGTVWGSGHPRDVPSSRLRQRQCQFECRIAIASNTPAACVGRCRWPRLFCGCSGRSPRVGVRSRPVSDSITSISPRRRAPGSATSRTRLQSFGCKNPRQPPTAIDRYSPPELSRSARSAVRWSMRYPSSRARRELPGGLRASAFSSDASAR